ncbi:unnamed protein product [Mytilus edulis]|uniref:C-type lectin domain-containing protein n=1 Tax=Mytilus edulis TaxID=6550 RepID=A0A8S3V9L9_MYTED|nr:unnamed protein product [Mytilus edulis]
MGSTDVVNGDWRWIYDHTQLSYKNFISGSPLPTSNSNSYTFNCLTTYYSNGYWLPIVKQMYPLTAAVRVVTIKYSYFHYCAYSFCCDMKFKHVPCLKRPGISLHYITIKIDFHPNVILLLRVCIKVVYIVLPFVLIAWTDDSKMVSVLRVIVIVVYVVCGTVFSLPCLTNKSKQDFNKARNALKSLENFLKSQASSINSKGRQWIKYNKHCYYFGDDSVKWTDAERKCREIGGYLAKIEDSSENSWIKQQISKSSKRTYRWLGSTDVVNGDWRWIYDQTQISYKNFVVTGSTSHVITDIPMSVKVIAASNSNVDDTANSK